MVKAYMVKYKIKITSDYNHSDYGYQKIFRAIYGYTQNVTKGSGKTYIYHRPGVLSKTPYIKKGKNEVIVPKDVLTPLLEFLKTGENPTHKWREKGNWIGTYTLYDVDISEQQAKKAMERVISNSFVIDEDGILKKLSNILEEFASGQRKQVPFPLKQSILSEIKKVTSMDWYNMVVDKSGIVKRFSTIANQFKAKF